MLVDISIMSSSENVCHNATKRFNEINEKEIRLNDLKRNSESTNVQEDNISKNGENNWKYVKDIYGL